MSPSSSIRPLSAARAGRTADRCRLARSAPVTLLGLAVAALAPASAAQTTLLTVDVPGAQAFGRSVAPMGDVDGDGVPDAVVGTFADDTLGTDAGSARIVSGADGSILLGKLGEETFDKLGEAVAGVGDADGDGVPDFAVTSRFSDGLAPDAGAILVVSGADGQTIRYLGNTDFQPFGSSVAALGDLDGDGLIEIAGSSVFDGPPGQRGIVTVFDGATGAALWSFTGVSGQSESLGRTLAPLDDVDGDGFPDLLTSDQGDDAAGPNRGRVWVLSGIDGAVLHEWAGSADEERLGLWVAAAGDVDLDGTPDMIVSSEENDQGLGALVSLVHVYSGATGQRLLTVTDTGDPGTFGATVAGVGDRDGDGRPEFAASTLGGGSGVPGVVDVFSGADGAWLARLEGALPDDQFGGAMAPWGDVDGDGAVDLAVGAPGGSNHYVRVASLAGSFQVTGLGLAGSGGLVPVLAGFGFPEAGGEVAVRSTEALGGAPSFTLVGLAPASLPFKLGTLWVAPPWTVVPITLGGARGSPGAGGYDVPVPLDAGLAGLAVHLQLVVDDPGAPLGWALSNGLRMDVE